MIYYFVWLQLLFHSGGKYKSLTAKKLGESTLTEFRKRLYNAHIKIESFKSSIFDKWREYKTTTIYQFV